MKKYKLIIVAICVVLLGVGAVTAYALEGTPTFSTKNESENTKNESEDTRNESENTRNELAELQLQQLKEVGGGEPGRYAYLEEVIKGNADPEIVRMTRQEVENMIAQSNSFEDVLSSLASRQKYPDWGGGSGVTVGEYWFDSAGNEKIVIILEQRQIAYINKNTSACIDLWIQPRGTD